MSAIGSVTPSLLDPGSISPRAGQAGAPDQAKSAAHVAKPDQAAIDAARKALAAANSAVDTDKQNHSPSCVACDEKKVEQAQQQLAAAQAQSGPGSVLDVVL